MARPNFQVMSRWVCTWAVAAPGIAHSATAPAAKANFIDIENPPIAFDLDDIVSATALGGHLDHRVPRRRHQEALRRVASSLV
jgi:hypothetical protein